MRAYACTRDFLHLHPAQGVLIFAEWYGGVDGEVPRRLCTRQAFALRRFLREAAVIAWPQTLTPAPEPMPFAAAANHAASLAPNRLFRSRRLPLVGKETTSNKSCGSAGARSGGNGGGERAVHIGTTKG